MWGPGPERTGGTCLGITWASGPAPSDSARLACTQRWNLCAQRAGGLSRKHPVHDGWGGVHRGPWPSVQFRLYVGLETPSPRPCNQPEAVSQRNGYLHNGVAVLQTPRDIFSDSSSGG